MVLSTEKIQTFVGKLWDDSIVPSVQDYIRIPNQSPMFDKEWETNGYQDKAVDLIVNWIKKQNVKGLTVEVGRQKGRTPLILVEVAPTDPKCKSTVMLYGHMDKQPPMADGWDPKYGGPHDPRIIDGKMYGRGGADDGYSAFAAVGAIAAVQAQGLPHARCVVTIEASEETQSFDLPYYVEHYADRIGIPSLVVCLDSGCGTYEQLWLTTSLRGVLGGILHVEILKEGVHSGKASGIVPSSFRIIRQLLSRVEDEKTGELLVKELYGPIPPNRLEEAKLTADELGDFVYKQFPFVDHAMPDTKATSNCDLQMNGTWKPTLSYTAIGGIPSLDVAGNVLRPKTSLYMSFRVPPTGDPKVAAEAVKKEFERDPPYGAKVEFSIESTGGGWDQPPMEKWLHDAVSTGSMAYYGKPVRMFGEGGSIPFMGMLAAKFPKAQFMVTGVLGPNSNAHGANEFLHINMGKGVTCCVAHVLAAHHENLQHSK